MKLKILTLYWYYDLEFCNLRPKTDFLPNLYQVLWVCEHFEKNLPDETNFFMILRAICPPAGPESGARVAKRGDFWGSSR